jgi:thioesterase domain-containing protein
VIAYEIAQQLSAKGEEVGLIVLFESWSPTHLSRYPKKKARRARRSLELWRLKVHVGKLLHMNIGEAQAYARERLGNLWTRVMRILTHSWYNFRFGVAHSTSDKPRAKDEIMDLAATNYKPVAYQGRVILFRANEYHTWKYWDPTLGWGDYLPNLEVHEVPGRHESAAFFTGPYAVSTAKEIRLAIDESCRLSKSDASPIMAR